MKFIFLALNFLFLFTLAHPVKAEVQQIAGGRGYHCALINNDLKCTFNACWPYQHTCEASPPPLKNPTQLAVGMRISCAITQDGVRCWSWDRGLVEVPGLKNVKQVSVAERHACALAQDSVTCWKYDDSILPIRMQPVAFPIELRKVTAIEVGDKGSCAILEGTVKCWEVIYDVDRKGYVAKMRTDTPSLKNPKEIVVDRNFDNSELDRGDRGNFQACAVTDDGVACWPNFYHHGGPKGPIFVPGLTNPRNLTAVNRYFCALDAVKGAQCWLSPDQPYVASLFRNWNFERNPLSISHVSLTGTAGGAGAIFCFVRTGEDSVQCF